MPVVINTNTSASYAARSLGISNAMLQKSLEKLSSGSRIVNPSDDAGGLAVAEQIKAATVRTSATNINIENARAYLRVQDGALSKVADILNRIAELKTLSEDPTKSAAQIANYNTEYTELSCAIGSLTCTTFNNIALLQTTSLCVFVTESATVDVDFSACAVIVAGCSVDCVVTASCLAELTTAIIDSAIAYIAERRAVNGAKSNTLSFFADFNSVNKVNLEAATSKILDVDVAEESTRLARFNVLVQAGTSMTAQANATTQVALGLLQ